jgi:ParB/RepB/Spo0J family partition protein
MLPVEEIGPNPFQPRTRFDDSALQELAASIKASGVLQPVLVRQHAGSFQLVAGERRLRAAQIAGLDKIPAVLKQVDDRQMMELALIENVQREDLNPIDEAKAYKALVTTVGLTHEQLSERIGKQRSSIPTRSASSPCRSRSGHGFTWNIERRPARTLGLVPGTSSPPPATWWQRDSRCATEAFVKAGQEVIKEFTKDGRVRE